MDQENIEKVVSLWDREVVVPLFKNLKLVPGTAEHATLCNSPTNMDDSNQCGVPPYQTSYPSSPEKALKGCSLCNTTFDIREDLVVHYSSEWHQFNLKRSLHSLPSVSCSQFMDGAFKEMEGNIPRVEEEEQDSSDDEDIRVARKPRIFFVNEENTVISIYRTLLQYPKTEFSSEAEAVHSMISSPRRRYWVIVLAGGGHFAAGVFKGPDVITHKTFHSYTVRAKQGGTQSNRDNKNATSHPKSAGASLRRYNEQAHNQHVQELMEEWKDHMAECDLVFGRWPKSNQQLFFGGQTPFLSKHDQRLRKIPFPTKKPSFQEVKKTYENLSQIYVHGNLEKYLNEEKKPPKKTLLQKRKENESLAMDEGGLDPVISLDDLSISSLTRNRRVKKKKSKNKNNPEAEFRPVEEERFAANENKDSSPEVKKVENFVYSACRTGNLDHLKAIQKFLLHRNGAEAADVIPSDVVEAVFATEQDIDLFKIKFGLDAKSPLHVAAENARKEVIWWLLDQGCDPCVKNNRNQTPYVATKVKEAKKHFQRYVATNPQKYDYGKANIPTPLTEEQEKKQRDKQQAKKKEQKKRNLEKEKERRRIEEQQRKEEEEKEIFLKLSDREKRALAAERRIIASRSQVADAPGLLRCFHCAKDISQIVPFEYSDFKLCSAECVRAHRTAGKGSS